MSPSPFRCLQLPDLLSAAECDGLVVRAETAGFDPTAGRYPAGYRDNDRLVVDDQRLADDVFARIRPYIEPRVDADGATWAPVACNPRFRFCRYRNGQRFSIHRDGAFSATADVRSWLTCQVYLNSADKFEGGETRFFDDISGNPVRETVSAVRGRAIVFDHAYWHDGAPVRAGTKYVLRTDVLFERLGVEREARPGHNGYVWSMTAAAPGWLLSSGRDGAVRSWIVDAEAQLSAHSSWTAVGAQGSSVTALASDAEWVYVGMREGALIGFNIDEVRAGNWSTRRTLLPPGPAILALVTDPRSVIATRADGSIVRVDGRGVTMRRLHDGFVWSAAIDAGRLVAIGDDGMVSVSDATTLTAIQRTRVCRRGRSIAVLHDRIAVGDALGNIIEVSKDMSVIRSRRCHTGAATALHAASRGFLSGGEDGAVALHVDGNVQSRLHQHDDFVSTIAVMGDIVISGGYDHRLRVSRLSEHQASISALLRA